MMARALALFAVLVVVGNCRKEPAPATLPAPAVTSKPPADPAQIARGGYVASISGCVVCHTPMKDGTQDRARLFAGGLEEKLDHGVFRTPNITPDPVTGIGAWTDEQIITAIRVGILPDGTRLLPIMPYPYYHRMTDADARAVVVFLRAQKPIVNEVQRSMGLDLSPVELPQPIGNVDRTDDPKAHGEYLANLMHCGACHTPQEGANARATFAGGVPFVLPDGRTIFSANITSDPDTGIGKWTEEQLVQTLRTMKTPQGDAIEGPMALYAGAWSQLDERDAHALAVYVKSVPSVRNEIGDRHPEVTRAP